MQTIRNFVASLIREEATSLAGQAERMTDQQLAWSPVVNGHLGRSAANQIAECAYINQWCAEGLRARAVSELDHAALASAEQSGGRHSVAALTASADALAGVLEVLSDDDIGGTLRDPFAQREITWADFAMIAYWNMVYHHGQICYIQTLYGDTSF